MAWWISPDLNTVFRTTPEDKLDLTKSNHWTPVGSPIIAYQRAWNSRSRIMFLLRDKGVVLGFVRTFNADGSIFLENADVSRNERGIFLAACHYRGVRIDAEDILTITTKGRGGG